MNTKEKYEEFLEKLKSGNVYTHGGVFHADDVFSAALINKVCDHENIPRPNVNRIFSQDQAKELETNNIVFDIGLGEYDHHQVDNEVRENGVPYASFGKLWRTVGAELVGEKSMENIDRTFVQAIDNTDNGVEPNMLSHAIGGLNPTWDSNEKLDDAFANAVEFASIAFEATIENELAKTRAESIIKSSLDKMQDNILVLDKFCPWMDYVQNNAPEVNFVVFESIRGGYNIQTVPNLGEKQGKILFPEEWLGSTNEETGMTFCHPNNFLASFKTKEQAIQAGLEATAIHLKSHTTELDEELQALTTLQQQTVL